MADERLTEPCVTMERLIAKPRSFSNLPAFLDLVGTFNGINDGPSFELVIFAICVRFMLQFRFQPPSKVNRLIFAQFFPFKLYIYL